MHHSCATRRVDKQSCMWRALLAALSSALLLIADATDSTSELTHTVTEDNWKGLVSKYDTFVMVFVSSPFVCDAYHSDCAVLSKELQEGFKVRDRNFEIGFYYMQQKDAKKVYLDHHIRRMPAVKIYKDKGAVPLKYIVNDRAYERGNERENAKRILDYSDLIAQTDSMCPVLATAEEIKAFLKTDAAIKVIGQFEHGPHHHDLHAIRTLHMHNILYEINKGHDLKTAFACVFDRKLAKKNGIAWSSVSLFGLGGQKAVLDGNDGNYTQITKSHKLGSFIMNTGHSWEHINQQHYDRIKYNRQAAGHHAEL